MIETCPDKWCLYSDDSPWTVKKKKNTKKKKKHKMLKHALVHFELL